MTARGTIATALAAVATLGASLGASAAGSDKGKDRPPTVLTSDFQSIWMTEWAACWRVPMSHMSKVLHIPVRSGTTPQQAAKKLAHRAVMLLYETEPELLAAADGCRNGILWRYYHPSS
jgi:hypothetical protein